MSDEAITWDYSSTEQYGQNMPNEIKLLSIAMKMRNTLKYDQICYFNVSVQLKKNWHCKKKKKLLANQPAIPDQNYKEVYCCWTAVCSSNIRLVRMITVTNVNYYKNG